MNEYPVTNAQLDRLVDGELPPDEYRRLLASLDDEPGGWRRCAAAFLEAQALQRDLGAVALDISPTAHPADAPPRPALRRRGVWPLVLAMAGCFLIAFTIGALVTSPQFGSPDWLAGPQAGSDHETNDVPPKSPDDARPVPPPISEVAEDINPRQRIGSDELDDAWDKPPGNMMVIELGEGNQARRYEVPYFELHEYEAAHLEQDLPLMPNEVTRALRRSGHELRRRSRLLPIPLENGRQVLVPLDEAEIVPVSGRAYQ